jgi:hypothetical protein
MSGPQVIEVVVIDSDINDTDEAKGEPDVTVNGKTLRMVQAVDGNWYGYFADREMAVTADATQSVPGEGLDFGQFCDNTLVMDGPGAFTNVDFTDTVGVALPSSDVGTDNVLDTTCGTITASTAEANNVVRESKDVNSFQTGQIAIVESTWPFIQLYNLNPTGNVVVQYNKGGGAQSVTLTFDTVDNFVSTSLDRSVYPQGAEVHATVSDIWLNIDPTDEDSWTFETSGTIRTHYQVFDENGGNPGDTNTNTGNVLTTALSNLMCEDNCVMEFNPNAQGTGVVATLQDNDDTQLELNVLNNPDDPTSFITAGGFMNGTIPITLTEQGPNSGVFGTYDESDTSVVAIVDNAKRGTSASLTYNEDSYTILVGHSFGSVDIIPIDDTWNSGEEIPVEINDGDANQNSRADEDLDLNNPDVALIPALTTGDPFSLGEAGTEPGTATVTYFTNSSALVNGTSTGVSPANVNATLTVQKFSQRALVEVTSATATVDTIAFDLDTQTQKTCKILY